MNSNGEPATKAPPSGTHRKRRVNLLKAFLSCGVYATVLILAVGVSGKLPFLIVLLPLMIVADRVMDRLCHVKPELMQLTRIPTAALPRRTQEYFEMHTPEFVQVGFRLLGDFRVKPKTAQFSRFFVNDDGTTILSSDITVTAGSVAEGTLASTTAATIADESVITIDLTIDLRHHRSQTPNIPSISDTQH